MNDPVIPEIEVLIATSLWLWKQKVLPFQFSIARGQGINAKEDKNGVPSELRSFEPIGPDIIAISNKQLWQIECKSSGAGKQATQRNSFDRGVASTVSYFIDEPYTIIPELGEVAPILGLALPATDIYRGLLKKRVPIALRKKLELWVLLYDPSKKQIIPFAPNEEL